MCRFTYALDQHNIEVQSFTLNVSTSRSLRLIGKRQRVLRVLPTIMELQEDGRETYSEEPEQYNVEIQSTSLCAMLETSNRNAENAKKALLKVSSKEVKDSSQIQKSNYGTKDTLEPKNPCSDNNPSQSALPDELKKRQRNITKFQGFGDFFPQDFMKDFDENVPTEIGIKNYLEKQRLLCVKLNCREEEMRESNKSRGPEVQSWLHFFG